MSKERIERFQDKGNKLSRWRNRAESLLVSSQILAERTPMLDKGCAVETAPDLNSIEARVFPVALMLRAMAAECLLKALW
jgi:hypothetical protein